MESSLNIPLTPDPFLSSPTSHHPLLFSCVVLDVDGEQLYDLDEDQLNEGSLKLMQTLS